MGLVPGKRGIANGAFGRRERETSRLVPIEMAMPGKFLEMVLSCGFPDIFG